MKRTVIILIGSVALCLSGCNKSGEKAQSASDSGSADKPIKSDEPVRLQPKWVPGNRYVQRMDVVQNIETTLPQAPKPMKQETGFGQDFALTVGDERPGGGTQLELEFLSIELDVSANGKQVMAFDSKGESLDDSKNPTTAMFRGLVGAKFKFLLDASNRVEKVEGVKELMSKLSAKSPPQARGMIQGMLTDDYFKQMVDYSKYLPSKPVKPGDTWKVQPEVTLGPLGTMIMDLNYTFKAWELHQKHKCALLEFSGTVKTKGKASAKGMNLSIENGKSSGTNWFDPELGMMVDTAINQNMTLQMPVPQRGRVATNNAAATPQMMSILMNQKVNLKLVEVGQ